MSSARPASMQAPSEFGEAPLGMKHSVTLDIPLPTALAAQQLYHVLRVDRELRPSQTNVSYRIDAASTPTVLNVRVRCCTVRQLRLSVNALFDNMALVIATLDAFTPPGQRLLFGEDVKTTAGAEIEAGLQGNAPDAEFELSGTGRAG